MRMLSYLILMIVHQIPVGSRLLWITEKGSEELNAGEVFEEIGRKCVEDYV